MKRIAKKLGQSRGETIAEVLAALVISALGLMLLAGMLGSSANIIRRSENAVREYVSQQNTLAAQELPADEDGPTPSGGTVSLEPEGGTGPIRFSDGAAESVYVYYYENSRLGNTPVVAYRAA